jgi:hypothetical protein
MKTLNFNHSHTVENFNSNNAWGFGGSYGKSYKFEKAGNLELRIGTACYRHTGTSKHTTLWFQDARVLDLSGHGKKQIEAATKWIDAIMNDQYQEQDSYPYVKLID